jgi:hypothetical protein
MSGLDLFSASDNQYIMHEVGRILVYDPDEILDLLESNDIDVSSLSSPIDLGDAFIYELPYSETLQLGTAYLIERNNSSFSGDIDNENIYSMFEAISDYWQEDEDTTSNVAGALIGGIVKGGLSVTEKVLEGKNKEKYGALDLATKQAESRSALIQGIIAQKKAEAEALQKKSETDAKNKLIKTISIASIIGLIAIVSAVVYIKKQKNG